MLFSEVFKLEPGITAVIGSGGKTTFLRIAGEELAALGKKVILTTSTHVFPFKGMPCVPGDSSGEIEAAFEKSNIICCGHREEATGKLTAPGLSMDALAGLADHVLVEADGSKGRPLKAHRPDEPVIPESAGQVICVIGWSGIGRKIRDAAHRPEIFAKLAGASVEDIATPRTAAGVLNAEDFATVYFINQADDPETMEKAKELGALLRKPCCIGSRERGIITCM